MINFTRSDSWHTVVLILWIILSFQSFQVANAQEKGKFNLGPQIMPVEVKIPGHFTYNPWPQTLVSNCPNSDFSNGDWTNWQGCYGTFTREGFPPKPKLRPCLTPGFATTQRRHVIEVAPGYQDPYSCDSITTVYPGEAFSARLGDTSGGGHAEQLKYDVTINEDNYLFIYRYAVVLESPSHIENEQPGFTIQVEDLDGTLVDSCGYFSFTAPTCNNPPNCPEVAGWKYCPNVGYQNDGCYWKNWTTIGMDLTAYALLGTVRIVFTTRGCAYTAHRGYAYISAYCSAISIQTSLCEGQDSATLTAPPGFIHYSWTNGDTTQTIRVPSIEGATIQCTLTAVNGCTVTISNTLHYTQIQTGFTENLNCAQRPSSFEDTTWVSQNQVTAWRWFFGDPASGASDSSNLKNPTHSFTAPGNYNVTLISYSTDGCSDTLVKPITIDSLPDVSNTSHYKILCSHDSTDITLTSNVSGVLFTWTATATSPLITGFSNQTTPVSYLNQHLVNNGNKIDSVIYNVVPHNATCAGDDTNFYVAVYPHPNLTNAVRVKSICDSTFTNVILQSNLDTTRFTWTCTASSPNITGYSDNITTPGTLINQLLHNTGFNIDTVYYHILPHAYGCLGDTTVYKVAVYPVADLSNTPLSKSICDSTLTGVTMTSHVTGTTFTWTCTPSSANITGWSNNNVGTTILNQRLDNTGPNIETVTYHIVPQANGCTGHTTNFIVTVNPTPHVTNAPLNQTICTGSSISVNLTSSVIGSTFAWTCTASSPNLSGFAGGSGNLISQTLNNSGYTIETVTYHITPTANGCAGPVTNYIVTVNPKPDVSNSPLSSQICSGTSTNINLTSNVSGTNFSWTATGSSPNVTGYGPGSGTVINQILINLGLNTESVTYHITPTANGCTGITVDYVVTIVSVPDVYFQPPAQTICSEQSCNIQNLSHVAGTTFSWTATGSSFNVSGYAAGSGNLIQQTLFNSGTAIETVTYTVSPSAFGCPPGIPQNVVVTVNPKPAVTNSIRNFNICSASATNIIPQSSVAGSSYTWTASGSSLLVSGYSPGSGLMIQQTLINTGYNIENVTYIVTPVANSCSGDTAHFTVTVYPVADVYFTPPAQAICPLQTSNITNNSHVSGASFTWTVTGSSLLVSGFSSGSGNQIQQTLNNSGYNIETVTYHVSPTANGCPGTSNNVIVTVNPNPTVTFTPCWDFITTTNAKPITLKGGTPLNGSYSGTGVIAGIFFPAVAGIGTFNITYSYSNLYGCNGTASQAITVIAPLFFNCGNNLIDIRDNKSYLTILIGTQCWMSSNLDYGSSLAGALTQRDNCTPEKFCYNDNPANCTSAGGLYQWDEIMQYSNVPASQGLCPPEWHIPTENEWNTLFSFYISNGFAGSPLKYTGYSGFNAYLDGVRFKNVNWNFLNFATFFWSSTARGNNKAWAHGMNTYNPSVSYYPSSRSNAFPVRCLKD